MEPTVFKTEQESLDSRNAKLTTKLESPYGIPGLIDKEWSTVPVSDQIEPKEGFPDVWERKVVGNPPDPLIENPIDFP